MGSAGLILGFLVAALATWIAGVWLTRATDAIDTRYKLGSAFGGLLILGVATSLPEIAIAISAALAHHYDIVIGTLIGGIAIQTMILSFLDAHMQLKAPLTFAAASLTLVLEATIVILVSVAAIISTKTPAVIHGTSISLTSLLILGFWVFGLWLVFRARRGLPWRSEALQATPGREHHQRRQVVNHPVFKKVSMVTVWSVLAVCALVILIAGVGLQYYGNRLAANYGINSGLFAATFIALAASLPDLSTGLTSIRIGDYRLAMSDIFGANAFMPALFIICDLISGQAILKHATPTDIWFAALGALLTAIYILGLILRPRRQFFRMGSDSLLVLVIYVAGVIILAATGG